MLRDLRLVPLSLTLVLGCANQTTFHTTPLGAEIYVNGVLCGDSPCVYHTRYGFPDRIHLQLRMAGYRSADFYLDSEPPQASYLLLGFGSYLFHTFASEYRFTLDPLPPVPPPPPSEPPRSPTHEPAPPAEPPQPPASPPADPAAPGIWTSGAPAPSFDETTGV
jgi:hypothetical protein